MCPRRIIWKPRLVRGKEKERTKFNWETVKAAIIKPITYEEHIEQKSKR